MAYNTLLNYVRNDMAMNVAAYANGQYNYPNIGQLVRPATHYFTEDTLKCMIYQNLTAWINAQNDHDRFLIRSEVGAPGVLGARRGDLVITYTNQYDQRSTLWIEIKSDFRALSVDQDITALEELSGNGAFEDGFAVYFVQAGNEGWVNAINPVIGVGNVQRRQITVVF